MYQIQEFAKLAGVTIKALHHYERLGLLKPRRTGTGYRVYTDRDLERLAQITALKFLGMPLRRVGAVLDSSALNVPEALREQRKVLEQTRRRLSSAITAIQEAEKAIEPGQPDILKLVEKIDRQQSIDEMKRYYKSEDAWTKGRRHYEQWPSEEWKELYRDVGAAVPSNASGDKAQALAIRWMKLVESETNGDPEVRAGMLLAWNDRHYWPPALRRTIFAFDLDKVWEFMGKAFVALRQKCYTGEAFAELMGLAREPGDPASVAWYDLFIEVEAALDDDPEGERGQALSARWWKLAPATDRAHALIARWRELAARPAETDDAIGNQIALFNIEKMWGFIARASYSAWAQVNAA